MKIVSYENFPSNFVMARQVDVWLPPSYHARPEQHFPVLYMHDGQNLFDPSVAYTGVTWGIAESMQRLVVSGEIREAIIVGNWNTSLRYAEYMPYRAVAESGVKHVTHVGEQLVPADIVSDHYLRFLVEELKPFIDANYRTMAGRDNCFVMGSSMGGLISAYALCEYPEVFSAAGCVSTHWPAGDGAMIAYLDKHLPRPGQHRFYFDYGTETLDAMYEPYQLEADKVMARHGYRQDVDWVTLKFERADHSERSWQARVDVPLRFMLG